MACYAHTKNDPVTKEPLSRLEWEPLFTPFCEGEEHCQKLDCAKCAALEPKHGHLNKVAYWTARFAANMFPVGSDDAKSASEWGWIAGLWHDLGKFAPEWQSYLSKKSDIHSCELVGTVDHATAGAQHAASNIPLLGHLLGYAISGHHSGLLNAISERASLDKRMAKELEDFSVAPPAVLEQRAPQLPPSVAAEIHDLPQISVAFFTRMLFSCLVDADFLATEAFMDSARKADRPQDYQSVLPKMQQALQARVDGFGLPETPVDQSRAAIYRHCCEAAERSPGLFLLTVPTGGGKTLSSLAFALRHALRYGQKRVIYVIPFTSIIEQNAAVFEEVFADLIEEHDSPIVLQHHSNLSPDKETTRTRLAAENWDAPLVVTTAVQFYESLHSSRTSSCRKLHNIANSVVILDEAQCLPVDYLKPCLETLRQLTAHHHTSIVLCTATQPAIGRSADFSIGLDGVREIIPDPSQLYRQLERVKVVDRGSLVDDDLASEIAGLNQVLAIVNTRRHAQGLYRLLPDSDENLHLSALMCPVHRQAVLANVRQRLDDGLAVRLISTQLIEAGVDVDFPRVYRSLAGLDSIAQAAGRCNRNGKLKLGETHVFRSEHQRAEAYFRDTAQVADQVLALFENPLGLESIERYFKLYYQGHRPPNAPRWDTKGILDEYSIEQNPALPFKFQFKTVSDNFKLIENDQVPIITPYDEVSRKLIVDLRNESIPLHRKLLRQLQQYTVQIYQSAFSKNREQFESIRDQGFHVLICPETHYSSQFGLHLETDNTEFLNI